MKKFVVFSVIILGLIALGVCFIPSQKEKIQTKKALKSKTDTEVFTQKALQIFEQNPHIKPSDVAQKLVGEMNNSCKNAYNKNAQAFTFDAGCKGCNSVEYDDNLIMIILTTYDKKGDLIARTVIKPPSFVVYDKKEVKN